MKVNKRIFGLGILLLFVSISSPFVFSAYAASDVTLGDNDALILHLSITDAYYIDLDGDEILDIVGFFTVRYFEESANYHIWIRTTLQLPSGETFWYWFDITDGKHYGSVDFLLIFYDHALETGDYTLFIKAIAFNTNCDFIYEGTADYTFDPPGDRGGGDPLCLMFWF